MKFILTCVVTYTKIRLRLINNILTKYKSHFHGIIQTKSLNLGFVKTIDRNSFNDKKKTYSSYIFLQKSCYTKVLLTTKFN